MFSTGTNGIDLMYWNGRLTNALAFTFNTLDALGRKEFVETTYEQWSESAATNADWILETLSRVNNGGDSQEAKQLLADGLEKAYWERLSEFKVSVVNHGLVEQCSIFESAVTDTLRRIFSLKPEIAAGLLKEELIPVSCLLTNEDVPVKEILVSWKLQNFSRESVEKKLKYFQRHFGIDKARLCDPSRFNEKLRLQYKGKGAEFISAIYCKRHVIIHDLQRPVADYNELKYYHEFLGQVLSGLLLEVLDKFHLEPLILGTKLKGRQSEAL
jgi:hypothetical protein